MITYGGEGLSQNQIQGGSPVQNRARSNDIEKLTREGLLALLPLYRKGASRSIIFTLKGKHPDPRGVPWLVEKLSSYYSINLPELRRHCGRLLGLGHHISLPLSGSLVLLPVKVRQATVPGETTTGFINLLQVERILPPPETVPVAGEDTPIWLSRILFKCGLQIKTLNTPETLLGRLRQGETVLQDFLRRQNQGRSFAGLSRKELLEQLPNCDCVLKEMFIRMLGLG
jgi:hypothetical protein